MGSLAPACSICSCEYEETVHRPLILKCGHTFCAKCITFYLELRMYTCPICREYIGTRKISKLPTCYQLLPQEESEEFQSCRVHKVQVQFWCTSCSLKLCRRCLVEEHKDCKWTLVEEQVQCVKKNYIHNLESLKKKMLENSSTIKNSLCENKAIMDLSSKLISALGEIQTNVAAHQQELLLMKNRVRKGFTTLKTSNQNWSITQGKDVLSLIDGKQEELESMRNLECMPKTPNIDVLKAILDSYQNSKHENFSLFDVCSELCLKNGEEWNEFLNYAKPLEEVDINASDFFKMVEDSTQATKTKSTDILQTSSNEETTSTVLTNSVKTQSHNSDIENSNPSNAVENATTTMISVPQITVMNCDEVVKTFLSRPKSDEDANQSVDAGNSDQDMEIVENSTNGENVDSSLESTTVLVSCSQNSVGNSCLNKDTEMSTSVLANTNSENSSDNETLATAQFSSFETEETASASRLDGGFSSQLRSLASDSTKPSPPISTDSIAPNLSLDASANEPFPSLGMLPTTSSIATFGVGSERPTIFNPPSATESSQQIIRLRSEAEETDGNLPNTTLMGNSQTFNSISNGSAGSSTADQTGSSCSGSQITEEMSVKPKPRKEINGFSDYVANMFGESHSRPWNFKLQSPLTDMTFAKTDEKRKILRRGGPFLRRTLPQEMNVD